MRVTLSRSGLTAIAGSPVPLSLRLERHLRQLPRSYLWLRPMNAYVLDRARLEARVVVAAAQDVNQDTSNYLSLARPRSCKPILIVLSLPSFCAVSQLCKNAVGLLSKYQRMLVATYPMLV